MSVKMVGKLLGTNSTEVKHVLSGTTIKTTAPTDVGGDGSSFSPTDLCAAALGACAITTMGMYAAKHSISIDGIEFDVQKEMSTSAPRRIGKLTVNFHIKTKCSEDEFKKIMGAGKSCPVAHSFAKEVELIENYLRV